MEYPTIILMEYPTIVGLFMGLLMDCYHIRGSYDGSITVRWWNVANWKITIFEFGKSP